MRHRAVYTNGLESFLLHGDPEREDDRFFEREDSGRRLGRALPVLLAEGWWVLSGTALARSGDQHLDFGCALVVLSKADK